MKRNSVDVLFPVPDLPNLPCNGYVWAMDRFDFVILYLHVGALCYKSEGRRVPMRWVFQFTLSFQPHYGLGSTQPLTEMSTRNLPGGKGRPARSADLTAICEPIV
jgi:hypothetical protein